MLAKDVVEVYQKLTEIASLKPFQGDETVKRVFINDIKKNSQVPGVFLVREKHMGVTKNGTPYLSLRLMDRTGDINARVWDEADKYDQDFEKNDFISASGPRVPRSCRR